MKTTLNQAIMFLKVFPNTEKQSFYVVSPRRVVMYGVVQMQKVFYSDHYFVETMYNFDEELVTDSNGLSKHITKIEVKTNLRFVKEIALIMKKVREHYQTKVLEHFNAYARPRMDQWIQEELMDRKAH
mmetsp:Transcript_7634/g.7012  ORF Transcript_7634/g.7012 Transcript_7634/m.7012 type:complete len:128 (-) Transcript_7634:333-716(-)